MPRQTVGRSEPPSDAATAARRLRRTAVVVMTLLLITGSLVAGLSGVSAAESDGSDGAAADVVFVFDSSQSTNENRYHMAQEIGGLNDRLDEEGIDARYGLVTYNATVRTEQRLTSDFGAFDRAMHFSAGGSEEHASDAIVEATALDLRENAETVVVVVTDEDDDSDNATRTEATSALSDHHLISVSPPTPHESSCAVHSPPCDNRTDNELRTMADDVDGSYIDIGNDADTIVERIGDETESLIATPERRTRSSASGSSPEFETESLSINRTDAEVGDPIEVTKTVTNTGTAHGTYEAYLSHDGTILAERSVRIREDETANVSFVHAFAEPGERELVVTHEAAGTVNVTPPRDASVETTAANSTVDARVMDARANGSVSVPLSNAGLSATEGVALANATVSIGAVDVTPSHDVAFDLSVATNRTPPAGVAPLPEHVDDRTYLTVNDDLPAGLSEVAFEYTAGPADATLYRYDADASTWVALHRTAAENDTAWQTNASSASHVAIGVRQPSFSVTSVTLADDTVTSGEPATATVTVSNDGLAGGVYDAKLTIDGATAVVESVRVPAGDTREVPLRFTPTVAGQHAVTVAGASPQTLDVERVTAEAPAAAASEPTATPSAPMSNSLAQLGGSGLGDTGLVVTISLVALALGVAVRRRR